MNDEERKKQIDAALDEFFRFRGNHEKICWNFWDIIGILFGIAIWLAEFYPKYEQ